MSSNRTIEINLITSSCDIYIGQSINGKKQGVGTIYYESGTVHICNWVDDCAHGYGICKMVDGTEYVGHWRNNKFHGRHNKIYYKNGDYYKGEVREETITGKGKMIYADGKQYNGQWVDGLWDGHGDLIYSNKERYSGNFMNGKRHSYGEYTWVNGNNYSGEWRNDDIYDGTIYDVKLGITKQSTWGILS